MADVPETSIYDRLTELGITLPPVAVPAAAYVPFVRTGDLIFISGHIARRDGKAWVGQLGRDMVTATAKDAARAIAIDLLGTLHAATGDLNRVERIVKVMSLVNSTPEFTEQHLVTNGCSELLAEVFGERGAHARSAFGVAQIPMGACVEIELIAQVKVSPAKLFGAVGLASLAAVGAALVSQHGYGMQPCPWCVLQRVIFLAIAIACGIGLIWRSATGRVTAGTLGLLLALGGIAAALWQHFRAAASASCNLTLADTIVSGWLGLDSLWPDVFSARASCADAAVNLLGVPYDLWSLALFAILAVALLSVLRGAVRGPAQRRLT